MSDNTNQPESKLISILAYLFWLIGFIMFATGKKSKFDAFHLKQGFILFITFIILSIILSILRSVLGIGFLGFLPSVFYIVFMILGIMNATSGKIAALPIIGGFPIPTNFIKSDEEV